MNGSIMLTRLVLSSLFDSENITNLIICLITDFGTVFVGVSGLIINTLIQRRKNSLEFITQNRLKRRDRILQLLAGVMEATDPDLRTLIQKDSNEKTKIKKRLIHQCSELRSLLEFEFEKDAEIVNTANKLKSAYVNENDSEITRLRNDFSRLVDLFATTEWNRIKRETTGRQFRNWQFKRWKKSYDKNREYFNTDLHKEYIFGAGNTPEPAVVHADDQ